jgi:hypothetical protein
VAVKVKLNHAGREYLHYPVTGLPSTFGALQVRFPPATDWVTMDWVITTAGVWSVWDGHTGLPTHARVLVAGPDVGEGGGVVLATGSSTIPELRLDSDPEVIIRTSPAVILVTA